MPAGDWMDVMYAIVPEIPSDQLKALRDSMTTSEAIIDPKRARETWGLSEDHLAMSGTLETTDSEGR